ncbi:hypothetical protein AU210_011708 [Fusarium oxysporum f. sp. radicis-cucumerinum]|uniref:Uncharacterized protein n=1 Tax=Fusarium oxysporum f. sp. radicis-cucumerinum TaxID=327505 RepID=A0A2H3GEM0_FUSOX|nr:hypothetical protein AU210_011708 [Fusarium oxysporum f. sp. radicis-cucumerinum]RKL01938.1 hypothetical protein BFJ71_g4817 [Fusarium oxysporum]
MASILSLPLHLIADILRLLDNIQELPPILLSHRIFYSALLDTPSLPVDIIRNHIPDNLLPLAFTAFKSQTSVRETSGISVEEFLTHCYNNSMRNVDGSQIHLTVGEALEVARVNDALSGLRDEFALCSLRKLHGVNQDEPMASDHGLSPGEYYRISRAFYRFQIYRNLFLDKEQEINLFPSYDEDEDEDLSSDNELKKLFFDRHSPWVNEQLACVYDFLETRLTGVMLTILSATPAYRQVVVNGFQWGDNLTEWLAEKTQSFEEQKCLSLGLPRLSQLLKASTYQEWQTSLGEATNPCQSRLEDDLEEFNRGRRPNEKNGVWRAKDIDKLTREVDADDVFTDDQPRQTWMKVHYDHAHERYRLGYHAFAPMRFIYGLRGIGYVMWDAERMKNDACKVTLDKAYRGDAVF